MSLWLIGIVCVRGVWSLWINFSTLRLLVPCGVLILVVLGRLGLWLEEW
jgi:hypothetical protein